MQIVVVDDERLAVETLVNTIKQVEPNSKVIGFRKGEEALDFVKNNECEVVFENGNVSLNPEDAGLKKEEPEKGMSCSIEDHLNHKGGC